jgi:hypothetical protein
MNQQEKDYQAGTDRLAEYEKAGLVPCQANSAAICEYLRNSEYGYVSLETVERTIEELRGRGELLWRKPKPTPVAQPTPPPPPAAEPAPPAASEPTKVLLSDGTEALPLDVDNSTLKQATKAQVREWLERARKAKGSKGRGFHAGGTL